MTNVLIVNGHQPFPTSPGTLNSAFVERARRIFEAADWNIRTTHVADGWDTEEEVAYQLWAGPILFQFPRNSKTSIWVPAYLGSYRITSPPERAS